jgi:fucose 4-O-acetylase-like acetyltransferase
MATEAAHLTTGRNRVVDMMKGLAIFLVVVGHSLPYGGWARNYIYMFHVPLFFFVSGYCFKEKYLGDWKTFVRHRVKGLWWPFVKYGVPMVLLHNLFCQLHLYGPLCEVAPYSLQDTAKAVARQFVMSGAEPLLGTYWFLNTLFGASLLFYVFRRMTGRAWTVALLTVGTVASLLLMPHVETLRIVFRMFLAGVYLALGHLFSSVPMQHIANRHAILPLAVLVGIGVLFLPHEMTDATLPTLLPSIVVAVAGILMCWGLCRWMLAPGVRIVSRLSAALDYVGRRTLTVMTWHLLCFKAVTLLIIGLYCLPIERLEVIPVLEEQTSQGWWPAYVLAGMSVMLVQPLVKTVTKKRG